MPILLLRKLGPKIVSAGLQVYYRFDEASGQTVTDRSGSLNNGILGSTSGADINDPSWAPEGLAFVADDYVTTASGSPTRPNAWTVCAAVRHGSAVADQPLVGWGPIGNSRPGIYLSFLGPPHRPIIYQGASNFRYFKSNDPVNLQDEGWHFVVFRSPGAAAADILNASMRVDGQLQVPDLTNAGGGADEKTLFRLCALGNKFLSGTLAFFTLHNRELSLDETDQMREFAKVTLAGRVMLP